MLLFAIANALWALEQPAAGATGSELVAFYDDLSGRIEAGALLSLIAIAIFVVFASALRLVLRELDEDELLGDVAFGGALLAMAAGAGAETINMAAALRAADGELTESLALALFDISYVLGYNVVGVGVGLLLIATSVIALRRQALFPRWLAFVALVVGVALLTPLCVYALGPGFLLVLGLGVALLRGGAHTLR